MHAALRSDSPSRAPHFLGLLFGVLLVGALLLGGLLLSEEDAEARRPPSQAALSRSAPRQAPLPGLELIEKEESSVIHFRGLKPGTPSLPPLITPFQELTTLGILSTQGDWTDPRGLFWLGSAKTCPGCGTDRAVYLLRLSGGKPIQFTYPGRLVDPKTGAVSLDSRAFYGRCLSGRGDVYVAFQKERIDRKRRRAKIENSVFIAELKPHMIHEELLHKGFPSLSTVASRIRAGTCWEVPPRHRQISGPVVSLKVNTDDDGDGDDDTPSREGDAVGATPLSPKKDPGPSEKEAAEKD